MFGGGRYHPPTGLHDDESDDEHEEHGGHGGHGEDDGAWVSLLPPEAQREVVAFDRARREVDRQMIHSNEAKLSGRSENDRRGISRGASSQRVAGNGVASYSADLMSRLYGQEVDVDRLAALLPRPGDGEKERQMPFQKMWEFVSDARFSTWYAILSLSVALASVAVYLYETNLDDDHSGGGSSWYRASGLYPGWFSIVEDFFLAFFTIDLLMGAVMADHDWGFWMTTETIVEVLSIIPSLLFVAFNLRLWGFLRFLRVFRWSDVATLETKRIRYRLSRDLDDGTSKRSLDGNDGSGFLGSNKETVMAVLRLAIFMLRFLFVMAGVAVLWERTEGGIDDITNPGFPLTYANAVYMSAMLLTTIGEGGHGPVPVSAFARCAAAGAVLIFLPLVAIRIADVVRHADTSESLVRSRTRIPPVRERHVVAVGTVTDANLKARLHEIFHLDHGKHKVKVVRVVVLSPDPATPGIRKLIESPRYRGRVSYIEGSPLDDDCLMSAGVDDAAAVMVLANKLARNSHVEDMNVSLQAISVMTHIELQKRQGWGPRLLVELIDPNAAMHLKTAGIRQVVSSDQLKLSVLAQSCLCPGWTAVVANFLESRSPLPPRVLEQGSWLAEYYVGAKKTFYSVEFSPNFHGMTFDDAVVYIFELFELILVAVESRRAGSGELVVLVNPTGGYKIGRGDRAFVLAETQADARVIWDYMAAKGGAKADLINSPEEEEASALETLGTAGIAAMGPQAFVDSMIFSRTLIQCQRRLPTGAQSDPSLILEWARQFQECRGMSDWQVLCKVHDNAGLPRPPPPLANEMALPRPNNPRSTTGGSTRSRSFQPALEATIDDGEEHDGDDASNLGDDKRAPPSPASGGATTPHRSSVSVTDEQRPSVPQAAVSSPSSTTADSGAGATATATASTGEQTLIAISEEDAGSIRSAGSTSGTAAEDILAALRSMEVSEIDGDEACRRLVALQRAAASERTAKKAKASPPTPPPSLQPQSSPAMIKSTSTPQAPAQPAVVSTAVTMAAETGRAGSGGSRRIMSAKHLEGHVVVLGFPPRPSHLECFLRPLTGWTGGAKQGGRGLAVVMLENKVDQLESALGVVERAGNVDTSDVFLIQGSCVNHADLENAGIRTAQSIIVMKDPRRRQQEIGATDQTLLDAEALLSFVKMQDGLLNENQHVVVELENPTNVRFLHARSDAKSLQAIAGLGGAGAGGPADDAMYLWPKYAAGMTYSAHFLDALFGQAFYRPSRLALLESLLLLNRSDVEDPSQANQSTHRRRQQATSLEPEDDAADQQRGQAGRTKKRNEVREAVLRQIAVPDTFLEHSFGELFQHLAAPPLRCVAFALLRSRGTRNAPEPYVYTGPRADTVLNAGDRVFVLGAPPDV